MKKFILLTLGIVLLAAACNQTTTNNNSGNNNQPALQTYKYAPYNFEFQYSSDFAFTEPAYAKLTDKVTQLQFQSGYPNTNFVDAAFSVSAESSPSLQECFLAGQFASENGFNQTKNINGTTWNLATTAEAAAGNLYESRVYRTFRNNLCFELNETIHTGNIGNYPEGSVTEVDKNQVWSKLDQILNTFKFN
jgi:hypothetical protein